MIFALVSVTLVSVVWTGLRIQVFLWLGEEYDIWSEILSAFAGRTIRSKFGDAESSR